MKTKRFLFVSLCLSLLAVLFAVPVLAADNTLTLREDWRLTSDLDLNVAEGDTLTINGNGFYIYELGGKLQNSGLGTVTFASGTILYPEESTAACTTTTSNELMEERHPHIVTIDSCITDGTVTATGSGTSSTGAATAKKGETVQLAISPASGYRLDTLTVNTTPDNANVTVSGRTFTMPAKPVTVTATFVQGSTTYVPTTPGYTLTFEPNGGASVEPVTAESGAEIDLSKYTPTRSGYTFARWYSDEKLTTAVAKITLSADTTVYAKWTEKFADIAKGAWYHDATYYCAERGYFAGVSETEFAPGSTMTRAMFATVLYNMAGKPEVTATKSFPDVAAGKWYTDGVLWGASKGIISGYPDGNFGPADPVTREQMAVLFWNYAGKPTVTADLSKFSDADKISTYAKAAMNWAVSVGIINGKGNGILDPKSSATRAEVAQIVMNYDTKVEK